jgi:type I restriction enzyme S subunit
VLNYQMPLPPFEEQRRIVARIDRATRKLAEATTVMDEAQAAAAVLGRSLAEAAFEEFAAQVGVGRLGEVCDSITDGDHNTPAFSDSGIPFVFVGNVSSGTLHFDGAKKVGEAYFNRLSPSRKPQPGDILFTAVGATLGVPALVTTDQHFCFQRHIAILKPNRAVVHPEYLFHMLRSRTVFSQVWRSTTGSAQPTVPLRAIRLLPVPVPPMSTQLAVVARLSEAAKQERRLIALQRASTLQLKAVLPSILDRAFRGEL